MTYDETLAIMSVLKAAYPAYYRDMKRSEAEAVVGLWADMFKDDPAELVAVAVKAHIASDKKGFPPHIGAIKDAILKIKTPHEMTELEAWALVKKALANSAYNSTEEFNKLPPVVQRLVGSPSQLREWCQMDTDTLDTVVASNFQRSYKARAASEREILALPQDVRQMMTALAGTMSMDAPRLEDKPKAPALEAPKEDDDTKIQTTILMLNRYRDRLTPERYENLYNQAMSGGTGAVLRELRAMLNATGCHIDLCISGINVANEGAS